MYTDGMPMISVIIINWNGINHLEKCLSSVEAQTYKNYEIIFVDNNSKDNSIQYVKDNYPNIKIIKLDDNYGFCKANNIGIKSSNGQFIALLNNDTEVDKDWLLELVKPIKREKNIKFVASRMMLFKDRGKIDNIGVDYTISGSVIERGRFQKLSNEHIVEKETLIACAGAALYNKDFFDEIGWFDEDFFYSYEDIDLSLRAYLYGGKGAYAPRSIVYHKLSATRKNSPLNTYYSQRNNEFVWLLNTPTSLLLLLSPFRLIYFIGSMLYFTRQGEVKAFLKAKIDVLRNLNRIVIKRKKVQSNKVLSAREYLRLMKKGFFLNKIKKLFLKLS
ncbi:glycosyltransferase family 2 protein [Neobacillus citreus]|uniref:Glycosyltransferase family 2 protein n=1 Tax=Neobacillus citreus TaxID=2833578 RepID=A0A942YEZ9_9BACI|nr:glycosyltransferase family 2 protein [Neobacillus citreus]MCH6269417.1 glycosyltransferase family 2 protein [Neobacillus citreus]